MPTKIQKTTDNVLYRKLAMRSQLKFGQFPEQTVERLIALGQVDYLKWVYYNMSNIDFLPEVKAAVGITVEIDKPGTNPAIWDEYKNQQAAIFRKEKHLRDWDSLTEEEKLECYKRSAIRKRNQRVRQQLRERDQVQREKRREFTAKQLQGINHGHGFAHKRDLGKIL